MAKLDPRALARFMTGDWRNYIAVLIHGSDEGAIREMASKLATIAGGGTSDSLDTIHLSGEDIVQDPPRLADEMKAFGMFGGFRIVHVKNAGKVPAAALEAIASDPPGSAMLIMEASDLKKGALQQLAEQHKSVAVIACYGDHARSLHSLIDEVLNNASLTILPDARSMLTNALGADRALSRSEIEKLAIYSYGAESISVQMVSAIVSDAGSHDSISLIDMVFAGDLSQIEPEANRIFMAGTHPSAVLSTAVGQVFLMRKLMRGRVSDLAQSLRIHFSRIPTLERAATRWSPTRLTRALDVLNEATFNSRRMSPLAKEITIRALWSTARLSVASG